MEELDRRVGKARGLVAERHWGEAALAWVHAAQRAEGLDLPDAARQAWQHAGESWRRDDRPVAAARALTRALHLAAGDPERASLTRVHLAGVQAELGRPEAAVDLCSQALSTASGGVRAVALDTLCSARQALGERESLEPLVADLAALSPVAGLFRSGQLARQRGHLSKASDAFGEVVALLHGIPTAKAGLAAAEGELGEVALLRGHLDDAVALFSRAQVRHRTAGRRALQWRAEAGRVRASVAQGVQPLLGLLHEGLREARERSMPSLQVEILLVLAEVALPDPSALAHLDQALALAVSPLHEGRALLLRAHLDPSVDLAHAEEILAVHQPWQQRARLARAQRLAASDPMEQARALAADVATRFSAMEMDLDARTARELLRRLAE